MEKFSFKSFLSHSYESDEINLYFFKIFAEIAEVQFEIDAGTDDEVKKSTNVTRLEKMVRDSDAFIGIYPFSGTNDEANNVDILKEKSKYFRLEMDLAFRSRKPAIIFYDIRFGTLLRPPGNIFFQSFDVNEVAGTGGFPNINKHKNEFLKFCEVVKNKKQYFDLQKNEEKTTVAVILSKENLQYDELKQEISQVLENNNYTDIEFLNQPYIINNKLFNLLEKIDFAIVDQGNQVAKSGLPAFFHGRFIPMIRVEHTTEVQELNILNNFLYNGVEVGYNKDKIIWNNQENLLTEISEKVKIYKKGITRLNTFSEASTYFLKAKLKKEKVFVSYSSADANIALEIVANLKKHFQDVFDYRDGNSIRVGKPWMEEIFNYISKSKIGINLLSNAYFKSGNCKHEANAMVAMNDNNEEMKIFPIKLYDEELELPPYFRMNQYKKLDEFNSIETIVKDIVREYYKNLNA